VTRDTRNADIGRFTKPPLLVAVAVGRAAVRTHPCNPIARKPPEIIIHAGLAHGKTALAALPAERDRRPTAVAVGKRWAAPATPIGRAGLWSHHDCFAAGVTPPAR